MANIDIIEVIRKGLFSEDHTKIEVELQTDENTASHFGADIIFAKASIEYKNGKSKEIDLAVKKAKWSEANILREPYFLDKIVPALIDFQKEMKIQNVFSPFPKCYKTLVENGLDIIIMENVTKRGFEIPRSTGINEMPLEGVKLIFKSLAKFHATSFAYHHLKKEKFHKLTEEMIGNCTTYIMDMMADAFKNRKENVKEQLRNLHRLDLLEKYEKIEIDINNIVNLMNQVPKEKVVIHNDFHNYNLMFVYDKEDKMKPLEVLMIDFQTIGVHSPVIDIIYYILVSLKFHHFPHLKSLLKFYYDEFSLYLKELKCNAEEIFPYSTLLEHWRRYSSYIFCWILGFLPVLHLPKSSENLEFNTQLKYWLTSSEADDNPDYQKRFVNLIESYLNYVTEI